MHEPSDRGVPAKRVAASKEPISVLLPACNQAAGLETIVENWLRALDRLERPYEFLLIGDGGSDGTAATADRLAARHAHVRVLRHDARHGFGAGLRTRLNDGGHPLVFYTDCDYPYPPADLEE